jgi:hypothetical protein
MRSSQVAYLLAFWGFFASILASAQPAQNTLLAAYSSPVRDPQAVAVLQQAIAKMGGNVPSDSTATGTVTIVAGTETDQGTIRILTRGANQTREQIATAAHTTSDVYSAGLASEIVDNTVRPLSFERAATSQNVDFPLPFLAASLDNSNETLQLIGSEQLGAVPTIHVRAVNTYASNPGLAHLSVFSVIDIWLDANTYLPLKVGYVQRDGGGAAPRVQMEVLFAQYQTQAGLSYPLVIEKKFNGVLWMTINIQSVAFNSGLSDADFPVEVLQ